MIKRKVSLIMVLMMVLTLMAPNFALGVTNDYSNHWAEESIQEWFDNDQLSGYEDGSFKPDQTITRAEFMTMINSTFEFTAIDDIGYRDVNSSDWYYQEIQKSAAEGYIIGYDDNTVRPNNKISRQEAALIISRINELTESSTSAKVFNDYNTIATWSVGGVGAVAKEKIMIGYEDDTFRPDRFISRAEALVTIDRSLEVVPVIETPDTGGSTGGGGGGGNGGTTTTPTAITLSGVGLNFVNGSAVTTASAITTSTSIKIITYGDVVDVTVGVTTNTAITPTAILVTTSTAINGGIAHVANVPLVDGVNIITILVGDREYTINITKEVL